jgi:hypothetical protein
MNQLHFVCDHLFLSLDPLSHLSLIHPRYVLENTGDYTAVMMCMMKKNVLKKCWDLKVLAKLDHGRATSYTPLRENIEKFLAQGS